MNTRLNIQCAFSELVNKNVLFRNPVQCRLNVPLSAMKHVYGAVDEVLQLGHYLVMRTKALPVMSTQNL